MKREIRGITFFSLVWEIIIFGGFISANELETLYKPMNGSFTL